MSRFTPENIFLSRRGTLSTGLVVITPYSTHMTVFPTFFTTPYPVEAMPGSIPRIVTALLDICICVNPSYIIVFLQYLNELVQLLFLALSKFYRNCRYHFNAR